MTRGTVTSLLLLITTAGCARKEAPAAGAGAGAGASDSMKTSIGMGGPQLVPRFVGTWVRPAQTHPSQTEAMILEVGGGLKFINVCSMRGVAWAEAPGDSLGLSTTTEGAQAPSEVRYHLRAFTDSVLVLKGDAGLSGRWTRATAPVEDHCARP